MVRVAALTTIVEFARMLGAAPIDWITQRADRSDPNDTPEATSRPPLARRKWTVRI
jgi:hypothetical protein